MSELLTQLSNVDTSEICSKDKIVQDIRACMDSCGYTVVESDSKRPWGAYLKLDNSDADSFVGDLFKGLSLTDAKLGDDKAELSPKILIVSPEQRLSWQYHNRRAERWAFLTDGCFDKSMSDIQQGLTNIKSGEAVQFAALERHRLIGRAAAYTLVAEIWQHTDAMHPSSEDDIVRLSDDYSR